MFLKSARVQKMLGGGLMERMGVRLYSLVEYSLLRTHKNREHLNRLRRARWERRTLVTFNEAYLVHSLASSVANLPGDFAEVGVFEGSTARVLAELKRDKRLHLFDTFEGLPEGTTEREKAIYSPQQYKASLEGVQAHLAGIPEVYYYKGYFPQSAADLDPTRKFAFVHMDVDLYQSTLDALNYFYPKMTPGGIMLSHDYSVLESVERAFTEFLADKPEGLIELPTTQCMIVKRPPLG